MLRVVIAPKDIEETIIAERELERERAIRDGSRVPVPLYVPIPEHSDMPEEEKSPKSTVIVFDI
jgi:hypothetical protein